MDYNVRSLLSSNGNFDEDQAVHMVKEFREIVNKLFICEKQGIRNVYIPREMPHAKKVILERKRDSILRKFYTKLIGVICNVGTKFDYVLEEPEILSLSLMKLNDCLLTWDYNLMSLENYMSKIQNNELCSAVTSLDTAKNEIWKNIEFSHTKEEDDENDFDGNFYDVGGYNEDHRIKELMMELESNPKLTKIELIIIEIILRTGAVNLTDIAKNLITEYTDTIENWFGIKDIVKKMTENQIENPRFDFTKEESAENPKMILFTEHPLYKSIKNAIWAHLDKICIKLEGSRLAELRKLNKVREERYNAKKAVADEYCLFDSALLSSVG